ncbi:MAG: nucleoside hydrolase [Clostridium sp.]|nr:nucleoside hydrolase [Clostridium sp.]
MNKRWRGAAVLLISFLAFAGCGSADNGKSAADEAGSAALPSDESMETIPVYSKEDDRAAAAYLKEQYGILADGRVPKVILDSDMAYFGDDAMCLSILAEADQLGLIDLLGVTITGGNTFVSVGTNSALTQLEYWEREDIPVYMGTDVPLLGFRDLEEQEQIVGSIDRWGVMWHLDSYVEPEKYHDLGPWYERRWGYSRTVPQEQSAVDFMVEQVKQYPGEVTILSVGAATNIAAACQKDASFAADTAGIIYMGTIVNGEDSHTPYADFNVFYDAEAFSVCLNSDFPMQTIVPHDAAGSVVLSKTVFDLMDAKERTLISWMWLDDQYSLYRRSPNRTAGCTDAATAVILLNPDVARVKEEYYVAVNTDVSSAEYGRTYTWSAPPKDGQAAYATFVLEVDTALYWDFATDLLCHMQSASEKDYSYFAEQNGQ